MTLKRLRKINNVKQKYIAEVLNVSRIAIGNYESGIRQPKIEQLPKLATVLNCSIEELVLALIETKEQRNGNK